MSSVTIEGDSPVSESHAGIATVTEPSIPLVKGNIFEDSLFVLISSRQVLSASYALGYFITDSSDNVDKRSHEAVQVRRFIRGLTHLRSHSVQQCNSLIFGTWRRISMGL